MSRQSSSIPIHRPPHEVFAYMDDVAREREWQTNLVSAEKEPPGPTRVGTRKRYVTRFMGHEIRNSYRVTAFESGRRVVYETEKGSAIDARSEVVCEAEGGGTRVTISVEGSPKGILNLLPKAALALAYREELKNSLAAVKARMESRGGSGS